MTLNVLQIVEQRLRADGYDGLTHCDGDCACDVSDLAPCGKIEGACEAGYRVPCECGDHDYHIVAKKPAPKQTADEGKEMKLYLYHVSQSVNNDYDTYSDFVCAATSEDDAKTTHPRGGVISQPHGDSGWVASTDDVSVRLIGAAAPGIDRGVICASFHAG